VNVARKHPEAQVDIDNMLELLSGLGTKVASKANTDANNYVIEMLERELTLGNPEEELEEAFDLKEEL
jgi:hypothetical protein